MPESTTSSLTIAAGQVIKSIFFPSTYSIDLIQPKLHLFRRKKDELILNHDVEAMDGVALIIEKGFLDEVSRVTYITHGFRNSVRSPWVPDMRDAMLDQSDQLVVLVSWSNGSHLPPMYYLQAAANIQSGLTLFEMLINHGVTTVNLNYRDAVSDWLANYMSEIKRKYPEIIQYAVGHSLGAHLFGLAGRKSQALKRISALDPAGPAFEHGPFKQFRLTPSDASDMVDVIHSDGYLSKLNPSDWFAPVNHYGTLVPLGTLDFYPNFGYSQPGSAPFEIAGSHERSIAYFIYSISNPTKFKTCKMLAEVPQVEKPVLTTTDVDIEAQMGYYADQGAAKSGLYYIETRSCNPWDPDKKDTEKDSESCWCSVV